MLLLGGSPFIKSLDLSLPCNISGIWEAECSTNHTGVPEEVRARTEEMALDKVLAEQG